MKSKIYPRILLKLSGESLGSGGVDGNLVMKVAQQIAEVNKQGIAIAIVIGGGNVWRFRDNQKLTSLPRVNSDYLGMLATVMNGVVLTAALRDLKVKAEVFSAVKAPSEITQPYVITKARKVMQAGGVVVLSGGTGKPFVTTDTAAAMRAVEMQCSRILKATNVDGVYDSDPRKNKKAKLLKQITYKETIAKKLEVMDLKAFEILEKKKIPLAVFNFSKPGLLLKAASGEAVGTLIS
jgi:uridylate kinase